MGWRIPTSRIDAASDLISSSSQRVRGCFGLGVDGVHRYLEEPVEALTGLRSAGDERRQSPSKPTSFRHHSPPLRNSRHRRFRESSSSSKRGPDIGDGRVMAGVGSGSGGDRGRLGSTDTGSPASSSMTTTRRSGRCPGGAGVVGGATRARGRPARRPPPTHRLHRPSVAIEGGWGTATGRSWTGSGVAALSVASDAGWGRPRRSRALAVPGLLHLVPRGTSDGRLPP